MPAHEARRFVTVIRPVFVARGRGLVMAVPVALAVSLLFGCVGPRAELESSQSRHERQQRWRESDEQFRSIAETRERVEKENATLSSVLAVVKETRISLEDEAQNMDNLDYCAEAINNLEATEFVLEGLIQDAQAEQARVQQLYDGRVKELMKQEGKR